MNGVVESIHRHPVKGLTPELMQAVTLQAGAYFPGDRDYAIEVGPSGFDPAAPKHISKQRFTVLARFPELARVKTRLDDGTGMFHIGDAHGFGVETRLDTADGRAALERFAASAALAHLWLVPNPPHNPRGDFGLAQDGRALNEARTPDTRYTFSTVALYRRAFFDSLPAGNPQGLKAPLAPMLRAAMDNGLVTAELWPGAWTDVGTPERLAQLNAS